MSRAHPILLNSLLLTLLFLGFDVVYAQGQQGPVYTQFMFNTLVVNPAYAGAEGVLTLNLLNRSQWSAVEGAPATLGFSAHAGIKEKKIGLGITLVHDRIGVHRNTTAFTNYAYRISLSRQTTLSLGLQAGLTSLRTDYSSLAGSANDPKTFNAINKTMAEMGTGIFLQSLRWQVGLSVPKLFSHTVQVNDTVSINFNSTNVFGYSRYRITLTESLELEPGILVRYFPDVPLGIDVNAILTYRKAIAGGLAYRHRESIDFLMRLQLTQQLQLGYSYDYPIYYSSRLSQSSHEIMFQYQFRKVTGRITSPR